MLAPICLFTYNRLTETQQTIEALKKNFLASESDLFVFSDGHKNDMAKIKVQAVRQYLTSVTGFKSVSIIESKENKGLANSIISGVSQIIKRYGKVIIVEDDLIVSMNFLMFMNKSLNTFSTNKLIFSISGFSVKITVPENYKYDVYFWGRAHSWGWATWEDRWNSIDWNFTDFNSFIIDKKAQRAFNKYGSDLSRMLISAKIGKVDSWYIRFNYSQFKQKRMTVYPVLSKVINNGFVAEATHTDIYNRIKINFDRTLKNDFYFPEKVHIDRDIGKQVYRYKSLSFRIIGRILTIMMRIGLISQRKNTQYGVFK